MDRIGRLDREFRLYCFDVDCIWKRAEARLPVAEPIHFLSEVFGKSLPVSVQQRSVGITAWNRGRGIGPSIRSVWFGH